MYRLLTVAATVLPVAAIPSIESDLPMSVRGTAGLLWLLTLAPSLRYFSLSAESRPPIPFVQVLSCLYGLYFALPAVLGATHLSPLVSLDPSDYAPAVELATLGWVLVLGAYGIARLAVPPPAWSSRWAWNPKPFRRAGFILGFLGVAFEFLRAEVVTDLALAGAFHFLASLSFVGIGLLVALLARGELGRAGLGVLLTLTALSVALQLATGSVANVGFLGFVVFVAAWAARGELPVRWLTGALLLVLAVIALRGSIGDFRAAAWTSTREMGIVERSGLAGRLLYGQVADMGLVGSLLEGGQEVARRSAHLELFADVIRRTPDPVPYWDGETYVSLVGMAIPRFLWPEQPVKELGQGFGHRYGYLAPEDRRTSINLPYVVEFYANHGLPGVLLGMAFVGLAYGSLAGALNQPGQPLLLSVVVLVLVLPLLNIESDFSLTFGGLLLHGLGLAGIVWLVLRASGRSPPGSQPS